MPKINVYLPDDLAAGVKETGLPVSAICQRALEQSVKRVTAIRATVLGDLSAEDPTARLANFTTRARTVLTLAITAARTQGAARVGTEHLLGAIVAEGQNLGLHVLSAVEVPAEQVTAELAEHTSEPGEASRFSDAAANALELTVTEAIGLGHNYVGCEHLLLGLLAEPDGTAGTVLRRLGAELKSTRQAVLAALGGHLHGRAQPTEPATSAAALTTALRAELAPLEARLGRLEKHVGLGEE
ncbi:MAG TPA: Clp protease N-terminal domain-containing protein [Asanoa sp.]|nr:Clp protease N-terminal domain-containing protein [Asanoa sp.]